MFVGFALGEDAPCNAVAPRASSKFLVMGGGGVFKYDLDSLDRGPTEKWVMEGSLMWAHSYQNAAGKDLVAIANSKNELLIFDQTVPGSAAVLNTVKLDENGGLKQPVAVTFSNGKLYTAMFGGGDADKAGVSEIDATSLAVKSCPYIKGHWVHNVHTFQINGKPEVALV